MLKQELTQKQIQKLSPAQIQVIKMLELPTLELEQRITQEIEENIALEEGHDDSEDQIEDSGEEYLEESYDDNLNDDNDFNIDEYISDDEVPDYATRTNNTSPDDRHDDIPFSVGTTFHEFLLSEFNLLQLTPEQQQIGEFIIGNIDEEGYLRRDVESIVDDLDFHENIHTSDAEVENLLRRIQELEPAGVGARDLKECLLLQLQRMNNSEEQQLAIKVLSNSFEDFSHRHFSKISSRMGISDEQMRDVVKLITRLNPKPGNAWGANLYENNRTIIIPDFIVSQDDGELTISLNNANIPELRINKEYNDMLLSYQGNKDKTSAKDKEAIRYIKQKIDSARWFIDAIRQRNETLLNTMSAIVKFQHDFFVEGEESYLRPMILKDIADMTGYDISTISRVSNSKYVQTEFGIYPLKFFFSESMLSDSGDEVSTRQLKKVLASLIQEEDKRHPLNDDKLVELMKLQGYQIARRTIAKYREQMGIPVARLRRNV
ncbi:MAG: RNA polymerase factor sigma-54 [Paludibacteraceae bacterium]|nr:RNA polymerase factor sigma-54 [Paludibacteraceae bacterium]